GEHVRGNRGHHRRREQVAAAVAQGPELRAKRDDQPERDEQQRSHRGDAPLQAVAPEAQGEYISTEAKRNSTERGEDAHARGERKQQRGYCSNEHIDDSGKHGARSRVTASAPDGTLRNGHQRPPPTMSSPMRSRTRGPFSAQPTMRP